MRKKTAVVLIAVIGSRGAGLLMIPRKLMAVKTTPMRRACGISGFPRAAGPSRQVAMIAGFGIIAHGSTVIAISIRVVYARFAFLCSVFHWTTAEVGPCGDGFRRCPEQARW